VNRTQLAVSHPAPAGGIVIRPVEAADCAAVASFASRLSAQSRFFRFFSAAAPSSSVLRGMCGEGLTTDVLVATDGRAVVGHAMAADSVEPGGRLASDIGLVVADRWQRRGLGSALLGRLTARAAARGVSVLVMDVLPENQEMLAVISRAWPDARRQFGPDAVSIRASLASSATAGGGSRGPASRAA
jgi:ribosomal protein S18 acetylase RimI-like enzyme